MWEHFTVSELSHRQKSKLRILVWDLHTFTHMLVFAPPETPARKIIDSPLFLPAPHTMIACVCSFCCNRIRFMLFYSLSLYSVSTRTISTPARYFGVTLHSILCGSIILLGYIKITIQFDHWESIFTYFYIDNKWFFFLSQFWRKKKWLLYEILINYFYFVCL